MQLHEQYRPTKWAEIVTQKRINQRIELIGNRGLGWGGDGARTDVGGDALARPGSIDAAVEGAWALSVE